MRYHLCTVYVDACSDAAEEDSGEKQEKKSSVMSWPSYSGGTPVKVAWRRDEKGTHLTNYKIVLGSAGIAMLPKSYRFSNWPIR